ncbi:arylsulfatase [Novipirellula artificiosorum]|uniref:Arylsulfatase n=1 Tax=Novipirellula artificiosorum TaxID=2528016 RepID=A0A5C6D4W6_9BACT|nr:arylsulfatase [Novipirellula artificiosorum]TWU31105.1 Arylsulfatase [Novipirellula artificiosorum]
MKQQLFTPVLSVAVFLLAYNIQSAMAQDDTSTAYKMDRTVLPIQPPKYAPIEVFDARDATKPPMFQIKPPEGAPNVVIVLIDDIGFGATSTFGGAIETPTFDRLAKGGLRFNHFHTTALCSPTRASLLSGRNHHEVNVGCVMEIATGFPGNQGERSNDAKYFAETLRHNGYSTAAFGKWHETPTWEVSVSGPYFRWPTHSGFDKFYGFIGGETNQWDPVIFDGVTKVEKKDDPEYHFTADMTNEAINWMKFQQAMTPDKPFFIYYAPGAVHAPHHAPREWIKKYDGKFDSGWLRYREETLARQKAMGIVPQNTKLAPMPEDIKDWEKLSDKERELFALQMEAFAGFTEHTDHEVGRLVDAIDDIGALDNTLFIYIMGDNGSSGEGGLEGTYNELVHLNGIFDAETVDSMLARADDWGGPNSFPHFSAAWAVATDAPFTWTKQMAADFGGTRNSMVMHWPKGFESKGEIRAQWHHVNDVAATVLEAAKLPQPTMVNGVKQKPLSGVSMLYATDDAKAKDRHTTQYFEMFANRAIYHQGWLARAVHRAPWNNTPFHTLQNDVWDLYNTTEDFSLTNNLADKHPEKLKEMKELFKKEAIANSVYPLDDRAYERFNAAIAGRPDLMGDRTSLTLGHGMTGILENTFINEKNTSKTIVANVDLRGNDRGVILCQGGKFGGWALYMDQGKPAYTYNWFGLKSYTVASSKAIDKDKAEIKLVFDYEGGGTGRGGQATIFVDGEKVAEGRIDKTQPAVYSADETADVGIDESTPVADKVFEDVEDSEFTGRVNTVTISIPKREK